MWLPATAVETWNYLATASLVTQHSFALLLFQLHLVIPSFQCSKVRSAPCVLGLSLGMCGCDLFLTMFWWALLFLRCFGLFLPLESYVPPLFKKFSEWCEMWSPFAFFMSFPSTVTIVGYQYVKFQNFKDCYQGIYEDALILGQTVGHSSLVCIINADWQWNAYVMSALQDFRQEAFLVPSGEVKNCYLLYGTFAHIHVSCACQIGIVKYHNTFSVRL